MGMNSYRINNQQDQQGKSKSKRWYIIGGVVALAVVLCVVAGAFFLSQKHDDKVEVKQTANVVQTNNADNTSHNESKSDDSKNKPVPQDSSKPVDPTKPYVDDGKKAVYLSFDDGPSENTKKIMDIMDRYGVKGSFFVTGNGQPYNHYIKEAFDHGHTIGLHTFTHRYQEVYSSDQAYFADLKRIDDMVYGLIGQHSYMVRLPGGSSNTISRRYSPGIMTRITREMQRRGYQYIDWNCDFGDASANRVPAAAIIKQATSCHANKIVMLAHDTAVKTTTVDALPKVIEYYKAQGYTFAPMDKNIFPAHHKLNN